MTDLAVIIHHRELVLSRAMTAETAQATKQQLVEQLGDGGSYLLQAGGVTYFDAAGAQLLYAFLTEVARRGGTAQWLSVSRVVIDAARAVGMHGHLGLPEVPVS